MDFFAWFTLGLTLIAGYFLISEHLQPDIVAIVELCALGLSGIPFSHPVNRIVMNPGGYKTRDFLRIGTPLTILVIAGILLGLHLFWG